MFLSENEAAIAGSNDENNNLKCGAIFFRENYLLLNCEFCTQSYENLEHFLDHIKQFHSEKISDAINFNLDTQIGFGDDNVHNEDIITNNTADIFINKNCGKNCSLVNNDHMKTENVSEIIEQEYILQIGDLEEITGDENKQEENEKTDLWQCKFCFFTCTKHKDRREHTKIHREDRKKKDEYICEICGKIFRCQSLNRRIIEHARTHTGEKPFQCDFCDLSFATKGTKRVHLNVHLGFKPFECQICSNKKYRSKHALKLHLETHSTKDNEKLFECELCLRKFSCERGLKYHKKRDQCQKYKVKPFECPHCIKTFKKKAAWSEHIRLEHLGHYNYKCNYCDKVFIRISLKRVHELTHNKERSQYTCNFCPSGCEKVYKSRGALLNHKKKKHQNINNINIDKFHCKKCNEKFDREDYYQEHCRQHINEAKIFSCECGEKFLTKYKLYCHLKKCRKILNREDN